MHAGGAYTEELRLDAQHTKDSSGVKANEGWAKP